MLQIDYSSRAPIYEQLVDKIKTLIVKNVLKVNEQMLTVRELASQLTINPNTVQRAYRILEEEGYIYSVTGKGSFVSDKIVNIREDQVKTELVKLNQVIERLKNLGVYVEYKPKKGDDTQ
ncbi:MAG TPA: GntR family transcriptional regulator [Clostridiales bacterium]|nr:MAG: hypothetical protein A2Y18_08850 [Clostridiales bacterium GWD2_32_19]HCC07957.1 GntR family transcriptional regulator [Clostridiales bacterium]